MVPSRWLIYIPFVIIGLLAFVTPSFSHTTATVVRVVDGDTLSVTINGHEEPVRLIGIDTPESKANRKAKKDAARTNHDLDVITAMGREAAGYVRSLVRRGDKVNIEYDVQRRDKYNRLLVYAYLSDGKMLNEEIIRAGYANIMTYPPNVRYQERFVRAYREARDMKRGLFRD